MIKAIAASKANEREWHKRFLHLRTHGEWFKPATELLAAIKEAVDHEEIPPDARESQINIRISLTEKAQLQANAERAGKKLAPFLRDLGLSNGNVVATAPQPKGQGGAGTTGSSVPVAEPEALATEIAKLKGQGMTTPVATREAKKQREA